jgi:2-haloacid dehalogenase
MYATLADPSSLTLALEAHVEDPARVAAVWRREQLEISWLLSLMGQYEDWAHVTRYALLAALTEIGTDLSSDQFDQLLEQTRVPALFDDVADALEVLTTAGHELAVLSNGTREQLEAIIDQTGIAGYFSHVISVDEIGVYKPAPAVYHHAARRLGQAIGDIWLVSANPFDAAGGKSAGMRVAKLDRTSTISYAFAAPPDITITGLGNLAAALERAHDS